MHKTKLRQVGGSIMLAVGLSLEEGRLVIEPNPRKRYPLEQLIAQCDPAAPSTAEDKDWLASSPVGSELL